MGVELLSCLLALELSEVDLGEVGETGANVLSNQRLCVLELSHLRDLDLKLAATKVKVKDLFDTSGFGWGFSDLVLCDLITASDTEIATTLRDEGRDIRSGQEDESDREVLDEGDVETRVSVELNVGAVEKLDTCLMKTSLCDKVLGWHMKTHGGAMRGQLLLGTANKRRSVRLRKSRQDGDERDGRVALTYWLTRSMANEGLEVMRQRLQEDWVLRREARLKALGIMTDENRIAFHVGQSMLDTRSLVSSRTITHLI